MEDSTMVKLFGKYGLIDHIIHRRNFTDFISTVGKKYQSIWQLKRFTRMNKVDPFRAIAVDYGFMNYKDPCQRIQLREIYKQFFEYREDERRLHKACIARELAEFLETILDSLPLPRELLRNPYPEVDHPLSGMVTYNIISYPQSLVGTLRSQNPNTIIVPHPDDMDEAVRGAIQDRAAFLGTGLRKRYYSTSDGTKVMELAMP